MSITPTHVHPQPPDGPVAVVCAATYYADLVPAYAFTFRVPATNTRFTIYTATADRYLVGETYALLLAAPDAIRLPLSLSDWEFLRHCLHNTARHWREAIAQADTGAAQPQSERVAEPGHLTIEPTPAGYRAASQLFSDELARVEQLHNLIGEYVRGVEAARQDGDRS